MARLVEALDGELEVRAVEAADDDARVAQAEPLDDLGAHRRRRRRGQREHARVPERLDRRAEPEVVGPEVVAPLGDAVRLVDDEEGRPGGGELVEHGRVGELLGGEEEELERVLRQLGERLLALALRHARVELRGAERARSRSPSTWSRWSAISGETTRVAPLRQQPGDLVDRRLARAGRQHRERVAPGEDALDRLALAGAQRLEAEDLAGRAFDAGAA